MRAHRDGCVTHRRFSAYPKRFSRRTSVRCARRKREVRGCNTEERWTNLHLQLRFFRLQRIGQLLQVLAVARREGSSDLALFQLALFDDAHAVGDDDLGAEEQPLGRRWRRRVTSVTCDV